MQLATLLGLCLFAACSVGEVPLNGGGGGDGGGNVAACVNRNNTPPQAHLHAGGATNAGMNCQNGAGCHGPGSANTVFTASGTVYRANLTTVNPGAVVRIKTGATTLTAFADTSGSFYFTAPITYPAETDVTACPDTIPMVSPLSAGDGACARAGCHVPGAQGAIHFQ